MTTEQHRQVEELFDVLVELPSTRREEELARRCPQDREVVAEVHRLLAGADKNTDDGDAHFLKNLLEEGILAGGSYEDELEGSSIGPYHILCKLGEGGFGAVYKAEQRQPVRRVVALKLIKLGFDTKEVIARFNSERQALARMDHPNIAKVLDAGSTDQGKPYFVLDYVAGLSITSFADQNKLSIKERLLLFVQVCDAIAHAHQKAIIHRDIKSGNVLAFMQDGKPQAKVIDFGIAKALTSDRLTDLTFNTASGTTIGTYGSMSPEQAAGSPDIDTRTDVYSLGVLLYELLAGVPPFDRKMLAEADHERARKIIREVEPQKPSTQLSGMGGAGARMAELRQTEQVSLIRQLRVELEWIPMKAMRKERDRRYRSPQQLADDVQNYLHGRPLVAGPESRMYRLKKSLRQHARLVGAIASVIGVLLLGIIATTIQTSRALTAERTARQAEEKMLKLADANAKLAKEKTLFAEQMSDLATGRAAALAKANEQLGLALLERAKLLKDMHQYFSAAMTAAFAIGFDNDSSGPTGPKGSPLLPRDTQAWRDALDLSLIPASGRLIWRSPAMTQHDGPIRCVAFSPDGKMLASGSDDQTVRVWDLATGQPVQTLPALSQVNSISFSPDGKTLASGSVDKNICLWDLSTGKPRVMLWGHSQPVYTVSFSPDGKFLASGSADSTIYLWDVGTGRPLQSLHATKGIIASVAFSPAGDIMASASADGTVCLWDLIHFRLLKTLAGHTQAVESVSFSSDGKLLASGSDDQTIRVWDLATGQTVQTFATLSPVASISFSPDGKTLASGLLDKTVRLWDLGTGKMRFTMSGHFQPVCAVGFSPDGKSLASGSADNTIRFWDTATGQLIQRRTGVNSSPQAPRGHQDNVTSVAVSSDGRIVASGSRDRTLRLWNAGTGQLLQTLPMETGAAVRPSMCVCFSPRDNIIAAESADGPAISLWNASTGQPLRSFSKGNRVNKAACLAFEPDGNALASGWIDNTIQIWDVATGNPVRTLQGHSDEVTSLSFSPKGKMLASGSADSTVRLWDVNTGEAVQTFRGHNRAVLCVSFSPDGKVLASGSRDLSIILWDTSSGREIRTLQGQTRVISSLSFSPDGNTLASASDDSSIQLWDLATGQPMQVLRGPLDCVSSVSFSPDGKTLVSGSRDSTVSMWDVDSDRPRRILDGHRSSISDVRFSPDGKSLASSSFDHTVRLWDLASGQTLKVFEGGSGVPEPQYSVSFGADGTILASGSDDKTVRVWDIASGKTVRVLTEERGIVPVRFSPDGKTLAYGSRDGAIHLWDADSGQTIPTLHGHIADIYSLSFSPSGRTLATGSKDNTVRLWDIRSGKSLLILRGHKGTVFTVCFSPDGKTLASGSADSTIRLWETSTGELLQTLASTVNGITSLSFSSDGKTLVSGADDGVVRLWDVATGRQFRSLLDSRRGTWTVSFSPDGSTIASGSDEHTIKLWSVPPVIALRQYLSVYRFANLDLVGIPDANLYGDNGFYARTPGDSN